MLSWVEHENSFTTSEHGVRILRVNMLQQLLQNYVSGQQSLRWLSD